MFYSLDSGILLNVPFSIPFFWQEIAQKLFSWGVISMTTASK